MPLSTLHHVGLTVRDLERSIAFYKELFDLEEIARVEMEGPMVSTNLDVEGAEISVVLLKGDNSILEFIEYKAPTNGLDWDRGNADIGAAHVCFAVDDVDAFQAKLEATGHKLNGPPNDPIPDGPAKGSRFAYFRDPDGITVEVLQPGEGIR